MTTEGPRKEDFNLEEFSKKSSDYYNKVRPELELAYKGKYAALDYQSERYWLANTPSEALASAKKDFPQKLFYVVQIGSPATYSIQSVISKNLVPKTRHAIRWAH